MNNKDSSKLDTSKIDIIVKSLNLLYTIGGESEKIENNELFETIKNKINHIKTKIEELDKQLSSSPSSSSSKKEEGGEEEEKEREEAKKKREEERKRQEEERKRQEEEERKKREAEEAEKKKREEERKKREAEKKKREEKAKKESDYIYSKFLQKIYNEPNFKNIENLKKFYPTDDYLSKNPNERGIGIQNYGNTCYQASLLQVLFFLDIYRNNIIQYGSEVEEILINNKIIFSYEEEKNSNPNYDYKIMNEQIMKNNKLKIKLYSIVDNNFYIEKKSDFNPILLLILYRYMLLLAYYWVDIDNIDDKSIFSFPAYLTYYNIFHKSCNDIPDIIPSTKKQLDANEFLAELLIRCLNIFCNEGKNKSGKKVTMSNISNEFCNIQFSAKKIFHVNDEVMNDKDLIDNLKEGIKKDKKCLIHERKMQKLYELQINNLDNNKSLQDSINDLNKKRNMEDLYCEQYLLKENYKKLIINDIKDSKKLKYFYIPLNKIKSKNTEIINIVDSQNTNSKKKIEINIKQGNSENKIEGKFGNGNNTFFIFNKEEKSITRISKKTSYSNDKFKEEKFENISNIDTILKNITINGSIYLTITNYQEKEELVETTNMDFINIYLKRTNTSLTKEIELPKNNILNINNKSYKIKAVIFKPGNVNSGHYYTKILINDTWYIADDRSFHIISDNKKINDFELKTYTNVFVERIKENNN